ncbi:MAG: LVIVD repeat-containing protein [Actinomycetota bacterium]|nr:hypothetical protein [Actinomycetota bacterium]
MWRRAQEIAGRLDLRPARIPALGLCLAVLATSVVITAGHHRPPSVQAAPNRTFDGRLKELNSALFGGLAVLEDAVGSLLGSSVGSHAVARHRTSDVALPTGSTVTHELGGTWQNSSPRSATLPVSSTNVEYVNNVPVRGQTILGTAGGRFQQRDTTMGKKTYFFVTSAASGLTVIDATMPRLPLIVGQLDLPHWENEDVDLSGNTLLISVDGGNGSALYVVDITMPNAPYLRGTYKFSNQPGMWSASATGGGPGHIANCIASCRYAWVTGASGGYVAIVDLGNTSATLSSPTLAGSFHPPAGDHNSVFTRGIVHDVNVDSTGLVWLTGSGGISAFGIGGSYPGSPTAPVHIASNPATGLNTFILHNSLRPNGGRYVYVTEENWEHENNDCANEGRFETFSFDGTSITALDQWSHQPQVGYYTNGATPLGFLCSAHWFDYSNGLIAIGHYQQGMRFLDVNDPSHITESGWWIAPDAIASASYFHPTDPSIIYVVDYERGVDVLHYCGGDCPGGGAIAKGASFSASATPAARFEPSGTFGFACPILANLGAAR